MNNSCGVCGYMLRENFFADFQIEVSEKVDSYRMVYDTAYQRRRAERMAINTPTERAIPLSCETVVGRMEDVLAPFENQFNSFFWFQGFQAAMAAPENEPAGDGPWLWLSDGLRAMARETVAQVDDILSELDSEELSRWERYFELRKLDIDSGASYRYLHGYEYAFCVLESTGHPVDTTRLERVYARLGLSPAGEENR